MEDLKKRLRAIIGKNYDEFIDDLSNLSFHNMVKVIQIISQVRERRFNRKKRLLRNMSKDIPESTFEKLLASEKNKKIRLAIKTQAYLALRVSEVVLVKKCQIDFLRKRILVYSEKTNDYDILPLPRKIEDDLGIWISENKKQIKNSGGYSFFSGGQTHISKNFLRKHIRESLKKISPVYAKASDGRLLRLYSSHSLRAYGISRFYEMSGHDIELTREFARHKHIKDTQIYIHKDYERMWNILRG